MGKQLVRGKLSEESGKDSTTFESAAVKKSLIDLDTVPKPNK